MSTRIEIQENQLRHYGARGLARIKLERYPKVLYEARIDLSKLTKIAFPKVYWAKKRDSEEDTLPQIMIASENCSGANIPSEKQIYKKGGWFRSGTFQSLLIVNVEWSSPKGYHLEIKPYYF